MNENIDLTKILKNCPKGWKFYSSIYGEVEFKTIKFEQLRPNRGPSSRFEEDQHPIKFITQDVERSVSKAGEHIKGKGECTLFPSKDQRDWSKFTAPWYKKDKFDPKTLKPFDKVLVRDKNSDIWFCGYFSHINTSFGVYRYAVGGSHYKMYIPYNDETKHLASTTDEAPEFYRI